MDTPVMSEELITGLLLIALTHTGALVWWASKTSSQLANISNLLEKQNGRVARLENKVFDLPT